MAKPNKQREKKDIIKRLDNEGDKKKDKRSRNIKYVKESILEIVGT